MNRQEEIQVLKAELDKCDERLRVIHGSCVIYKGRYCTVIKDDRSDEWKEKRKKIYNELRELMTGKERYENGFI